MGGGGDPPPPVHALAATEIRGETGDAFAAKTGFDPRQLTSTYLYFRIHPQRLQAWREASELAGRDLMRVRAVDRPLTKALCLALPGRVSIEPFDMLIWANFGGWVDADG